MLEIRDLLVSLGGRPVLNGIDMTAVPGEVTVILGPNGSGKSTLIRAMAGDVAYRGRITLQGRDIGAVPARELAAMRAVLEQATTVAFPFTVGEIVLLGLQAGVEAARRGIVSAALAEVGLSDMIDRPIHALSGGQQARAHLARVRAQIWQPVAHDTPRWIFLDEPVASLDIRHQLEVMEIMRRFADAGGGVVAVMHDLNLSAMVADRMVLLAEGRIVAAGRPDEVMRDGPLSEAYGCGLRVGEAPASRAWILPQAVAARP